LIIDDNPDITLTFKEGLEAENKKRENNNIFFEVFAYSDPVLALSEFKPDNYDLMLIDINMSKMSVMQGLWRLMLTQRCALCPLAS
jgi:two-component system catabolic regulation response regulator CreB/two-component system response regulator ChvI